MDCLEITYQNRVVMHFQVFSFSLNLILGQTEWRKTSLSLKIANEPEGLIIACNLRSFLFHNQSGMLKICRNVAASATTGRLTECYEVPNLQKRRAPNQSDQS
jgi:hypothetical protein